jgi:hypothetical protein
MTTEDHLGRKTVAGISGPCASLSQRSVQERVPIEGQHAIIDFQGLREPEVPLGHGTVLDLINHRGEEKDQLIVGPVNEKQIDFLDPKIWHFRPGSQAKELFLYPSMKVLDVKIGTEHLKEI